MQMISRRYGIVIAAAVFLLVWLAWLWYGKQPQAPQSYLVAPPAKAVAGINKVDHPAPPRIKVIPKAEASKKLKLPAEVATDNNQQVISTADIGPAPDGATAVTTMNTTTGESSTLVKAKPRPLFSFLRNGAAGMRYGIDTSGQQQAVLFIRQDVARVGNVYMSFEAEARTVPARGTSEAYGAVEVSYRW